MINGMIYRAVFIVFFQKWFSKYSSFRIAAAKLRLFVHVFVITFYEKFIISRHFRPLYRNSLSSVPKFKHPKAPQKSPKTGEITSFAAKTPFLTKTKENPFRQIQHFVLLSCYRHESGRK
jgi:hypothetical protein